MTYKEILQREKRIDSELKKQGYSIPETSGIYVFKRTETYVYVGQAKNLKRRVIQHITDYKQPIDYSLKSRKLYSKDNLKGWKIGFLNVEESQLNEMERKFIEKYLNDGVVLYNVTNGGQDAGKFDINKRKPSKTYKDGVEYGREKEKEKIQAFFKYLDISVKGASNKIKERKLKEFMEYLGVNNGL